MFRFTLIAALFSVVAYGEANPYDTANGYYNTKGAYSDANSADVKARVSGQPTAQQIGANALDILGRQNEERKNNRATCDDAARCHVESVRLPASFADAVQAREETFSGAEGSGKVGLDEKLVEVERIASYGQTSINAVVGWIEGQLYGMDGDPSYTNPNSPRYAVREALREERDAQARNANAFGISAKWANRGYRALIENPTDSEPVGNGNVATAATGGASVAASASGTPGEISNTGSGPNGKPSENNSAAEFGKVGAPGTLNGAEALSGSPLEQGRQMAYDMLRAQGFTPVGSLREVAIQRGDLSPAGDIAAADLKDAGKLQDAKKLDAAGGLSAADFGNLSARLKGASREIAEDDGLAANSGRGAKAKRSAFRTVTPFEDDAPPASMLRGLSAAAEKDLRLKWRLFRLTQERERVLAEAGPMIAKLRSLGIKTLTQGQSIFQTASRNYRTFDRWRAPNRSRKSASIVGRGKAAITANR